MSELRGSAANPDLTFPELLTRAGINKAELARRLGLNSNSVSNWKDEPMPYAIAYLELLIAYNRVRP